MKKYLKKLIMLLVFAGAIYLTAILTPQAFRVHYHANMSAYIDGKKWDFSLSKYMEEVERCNVTVGVRPQDRIHLHDSNGDVVHVHMAASTWGDLFANLYWTLMNDAVRDDIGGEYRTGSGKTVHYILNGEQLLMSPANTAVKSEDSLLVYYGTGTFEYVRDTIYPLVVRNAHEYNEKQDPASCSQNAQASVFDGIWESIKEKFPHSHSPEDAH